MIPLLNFIAVILLIFVTSYLFIEMYNIKMYLETNENQLNNLVDDINHNNKVLEGKLDDDKSVTTGIQGHTHNICGSNGSNCETTTDMTESQ
jgi:hypothetical protein